MARAIACAAALVLVLTSGAVAGSSIVVRVTGSASSSGTSGCFLLLRAHIVGGGTQTYCLQRFTGRPGPRAVVRDSGVMTFRLGAGSIRAEVDVVQRFAADGAHATQTLHGTIAGGTGRYRGARGTVSGAGTDVERPPGHIVSSELRYVLKLP